MSDCFFGGVAEWLKATDCKSVLSEYVGSNPTPSTREKKRKLRVSYIGITLAFQANEVGSIPITRSMWLGMCSPSSVGRALPW